MKSLRKNNKKGFTLVEIIVVLVILAVLAAAAIPTMLGFVEDAKGKAEIANARAAYLACQMIATEEAATGVTSANSELNGTKDIVANTSNKLNTLLGKDMAGAKVTATVTSGKVTNVVFVHGGYTVTISGVGTSGGTTKVEKTTNP